jgi:hypothetical protein
MVENEGCSAFACHPELSCGVLANNIKSLGEPATPSSILAIGLVSRMRAHPIKGLKGVIGSRVGHKRGHQDILVWEGQHRPSQLTSDDASHDSVSSARALDRPDSDEHRRVAAHPLERAERIPNQLAVVTGQGNEDPGIAKLRKLDHVIGDGIMACYLDHLIEFNIDKCRAILSLNLK